MNVENLHDAIGLLPGDLIEEADQRRSGRKKIIPWQRYSAMAACLAMILCGSLLFTRFSAAKSAAEAPEMLMQDNAMGAAAQAAPAEAAPRQETEAEIATFAAAEDATDNSHSHTPGREESISQEQGAWCGMITATIVRGEEVCTLTGTQAAALAEILYPLPYAEENLCRCMAEFTVDIETGTLYEVSLSQYFVRCSDAQASLTEEQAAKLQTILKELEE